MSLRDNYQSVLLQIVAACAKAGRSQDSVRLIAVSKTHPVSLVDELAALGQVDFGENRIADLAEKRAGAQNGAIHWHLIGQLQTNKVKLLNQDILLHTLDRFSLAQKLQQQFAPRDQKIRVLIQVNCSHEPNKSGVAINAFDALVDEVAALPAIEVLGLMTMAENTKDEPTIRAAFSTLRKLSEKLGQQKIFPKYGGILSMGMSGDFEFAIAEGATHVRIGSAIFGQR